MGKPVFVKRDGIEYGPFEFSEVQEMLRNGGFKPQDEMKAEGDKTWRPAGSFLKTLGIAVVAGAGGILIANLMSETAQAATGTDAVSAVGRGAADTVSGFTPTRQWDVDNNGTVDVEHYDIDGDGIDDVAILADRNGDGIADAGLDTNGDGVADVGFADLNGDGIVDTHIIDANFDGIPDVAITDIDGDGIGDVATSLSETGDGIIAAISETLSGLFG